MKNYLQFSYFVAGTLILLAGSISGTPYLASFLAILPLTLVSATLAILFPVFLLIYAFLPGLGAALSKQGKTLYGITVFVLYPVVLSIFLIYIALIEPGQSSQAFITLITIWISALFLGKSLANSNNLVLVQEVLKGLIFLEILSPLGALIARFTNSFHGDLDIMLVSAMEAAGGTLGLALWYNTSKRITRRKNNIK